MDQSELDTWPPYPHLLSFFFFFFSFFPFKLANQRPNNLPLSLGAMWSQQPLSLSLLLLSSSSLATTLSNLMVCQRWSRPHQPPQMPPKPSLPIPQATTCRRCREWTHALSRFNDQILSSVYFLRSLWVFLEPWLQEVPFGTHIAG